jgi:hypothetical protein
MTNPTRQRKSAYTNKRTTNLTSTKRTTTNLTHRTENKRTTSPNRATRTQTHNSQTKVAHHHQKPQKERGRRSNTNRCILKPPGTTNSKQKQVRFIIRQVEELYEESKPTQSLITRKYQPTNRWISGKNTTTRTRNKKTNHEKTIKSLYVNANSIISKINSLQSATELHSSHIVAVCETKVKSENPPALQGYEWTTRNRVGRQGGGVAIAIRNDIVKYTSPVNDLEDYRQEVEWIELKTMHRAVYIGCYYGKQENAAIEEIEQEYAKLTNQIIHMKRQGDVILVGDFNAKIGIDKTGTKIQDTSRNGKLLEKLITETKMIPVSTNAERGVWTWVNRNNPECKSVIDYILVTNELAKETTNVIVDEEGVMRLKTEKGKRNETDHNTITLTLNIKQKNRKEKITKWKKGDREGWEEFNKEMNKYHPSDYQQMDNMIREALKKTIGNTTITPSKTYKIK